MIYRVRKVTYSVTLGTCYNRLMLSRESKTYHLTALQVRIYNRFRE